MLDDPIPELKQKLAQYILEDITSLYFYGSLIGLDHSRLSNLECGRLEHFSVQRLIRLLARMNRRVDITVVRVGQRPTYAELKRARGKKTEG